jgi:hypothetical protein
MWTTSRLGCVEGVAITGGGGSPVGRQRHTLIIGLPYWASKAFFLLSCLRLLTI